MMQCMSSCLQLTTLATACSLMTAEPQPQDVRMVVSHTGMVGTLSFRHGGEHHEFNLFPHSVFTDDAEIIFHRESGTERVEVPKSPLFRADDEGHRAVVRLLEDGSVEGLFEHLGSILQVHPAGQGKHHVEHLLGSRISRRANASSRRLAPRIAVEDEDAHFDDPSDLPEDELPQAENHTHRKYKTAAMAKWGGQRWYPGCYPGDGALHQVKIGIAVDVKGWQKHHDDEVSLMDHIQASVAQASIIYEMQMHIRLRINTVTVHQTEHGAPPYAVGCPANLMGTKLDQLTEAAPGLKRNAVWHLFTGCGRDYGEVGLAYMGTICMGGVNTGVSQIHDRSSHHTFLTFAHELGHNFGADHSFEEGQGTTGGIMDYGDGHYHGVYQFNSRYRKDEVCKVLQRKVGHCHGNFDSAPAEQTALRPTLKPKPTDAPAELGDCVTVGHSGVGNGHICVFPFKYKDITYEGCTPVDRTFGGLWCATEVDGSSHLVEGKWGECTWTPQCMGKDSPCTTTGDQGNAGKECIFPFKHHGVEYQTCTYVRLDVLHAGSMWCATKVDVHGEMVDWGECSKTDYCTNQWKTVGWAGVPATIATDYGNQAWDFLKNTTKHHSEGALHSIQSFFSSLWGNTFGKAFSALRSFFGWKDEGSSSGAGGSQRLYAALPPLFRQPGRFAWGAAAGALVLMIGGLVTTRRWQWRRRADIDNDWELRGLTGVEA
mmetsp:Transcript_87522/g.203594  ORF Transcript_87522/g.203594 Transcript_87522/m.203594 type:complete len:712 (-) Transcript_87522:444-2579(-)